MISVYVFDLWILNVYVEMNVYIYLFVLFCIRFIYVYVLKFIMYCYV